MPFINLTQAILGRKFPTMCLNNVYQIQSILRRFKEVGAQPDRLTGKTKQNETAPNEEVDY